MVQRADINNVLSEIRSLRAQMMQNQKVVREAPPEAAQEIGQVGQSREAQGPNFGSMLKHAIDGVNETQQTASKLANAYERGDPSADLTRVMIASQKASVSFQALTQVRNKVVQAYEDIMKMPL